MKHRSSFKINEIVLKSIPWSFRRFHQSLTLNLVVFWWFNQLAWFRILALRQQLAVYKRKEKKPRLRNRDRLFWSLLSKAWRDWASELIIVKPETVIRWRKRKFREFWRRKSQGRLGRPAIPKEHMDFIRPAFFPVRWLTLDWALGRPLSP